MKKFLKNSLNLFPLFWLSFGFILQSTQAAEKEIIRKELGSSDKVARLDVSQLEFKEFNFLNKQQAMKLHDEAFDGLPLYGKVKGYVAYLGEEVVGLVFIRMYEDDIQIYRLATSHKYKNYGVGRALVNFLKEEFCKSKKLSVNSFSLSIDFYKKCGFKQTKDDDPSYLEFLLN